MNTKIAKINSTRNLQYLSYSFTVFILHICCLYEVNKYLTYKFMLLTKHLCFYLDFESEIINYYYYYYYYYYY